MTCIVGVEAREGVVIGGDSAGVAGLSLTVRADEKVFVRDQFVMGFTSSFRMGQLLRYGSLDPDMRKAHDDPDRFMATTFIDAIRTLLKNGGYAKVDSGEERGGCFLVGFAGRLYIIDSDFQVGRPADGYSAVGCGGDIAVGAMFASRGDATRRVEQALEAAERWSAGVRAPFHVAKGGAAR